MRFITENDPACEALTMDDDWNQSGNARLPTNDEYVEMLEVQEFRKAWNEATAPARDTISHENGP